MSIVGDLTKELDNLESEHGVEISAVVSRSGVPIAWHIPDGASAETIATLSATIFGASEVIYSGLGKEKPHKVTVESGADGVFTTRSLGQKALLVMMSQKLDKVKLEEVAQLAERKIKEAMSNE